VIAVQANVEAETDFADEGLNLPGRKEIAADIARLADDVALLHDSFRRGRLARDGVLLDARAAAAADQLLHSV